jgi:hypothetical protein
LPVCRTAGVLGGRSSQIFRTCSDVGRTVGDSVGNAVGQEDGETVGATVGLASEDLSAHLLG